MTGVQRRFVLEIDYRQSVSQMLAAPGFDELDNYLADPTRYSVHGTGVCAVRAVLFRPAVGRAKAAEIAADLAELSFMPARTEHLLAFARDYPEEHAGDDPITATDAMVFNGADKPPGVLTLCCHQWPDEPSRDLGQDSADRDLNWLILAVDERDIASLPSPLPWPPTPESRSTPPTSAAPPRRPPIGLASVDPGRREIPTFSELIFARSRGDARWASFDRFRPGRCGRRLVPYRFGQPPPAEWDPSAERIDTAEALLQRLEHGHLPMAGLQLLVQSVSEGKKVWGPVVCVIEVAPPSAATRSFGVGTLPYCDEPAAIFLLDVWPDRVEIVDLQVAVHPALESFPPSALVAYQIYVDAHESATVEPIKEIVLLQLAEQDPALAAQVTGSRLQTLIIRARSGLRLLYRAVMMGDI